MWLPGATEPVVAGKLEADDQGAECAAGNAFTRERTGENITDGGRDREAHGAEAARVDPGVRLVELPVLGRVHLVLSHAGGDDVLSLDDLVQTQEQFQDES